MKIMRGTVAKRLRNEAKKEVVGTNLLVQPIYKKKKKEYKAQKQKIK